jgi:hypothetical protein
MLGKERSLILRDVMLITKLPRSGTIGGAVKQSRDMELTR